MKKLIIQLLLDLLGVILKSIILIFFMMWLVGYIIYDLTTQVYEVYHDSNTKTKI